MTAVRTDLNGLKDQLKIIFDGANTTTSSPIDLSSGLSTRVQRVMTVHPEMIRPQMSFYPFVTCYITDKSFEKQDIARTQLGAQRVSKVGVEVVGCVFNQNMTSVDKDPADTDITLLMENIELVLRGNDNLNSTVKFHLFDSVQYYTSRLDGNNFIRAGILKFHATVIY